MTELQKVKIQLFVNTEKRKKNVEIVSSRLGESCIKLCCECIPAMYVVKSK